jgi:hypothetical protein
MRLSMPTAAWGRRYEPPESEAAFRQVDSITSSRSTLGHRSRGAADAESSRRRADVNSQVFITDKEVEFALRLWQGRR